MQCIHHDIEHIICLAFAGRTQKCNTQQTNPQQGAHANFTGNDKYNHDNKNHGNGDDDDGENDHKDMDDDDDDDDDDYDDHESSSTGC